MTTAPVITICSQKGGVGKTTTAANLGYALAESGRKVALIDTDPQSSLAYCFGHDGEAHPGIYDVLLERASLGQAVLNTQHRLLKLVPAGRAPDDAEAVIDAHVMRAAITPLRRLADVVVIDTPAGLTPGVVELLRCSNGVLVPVQCAPLAVMTLPRVLERLARIQTLDGRRLSLLGLLLNELDAKNPTSTAVANEVLGHLGQHLLFETIIPYVEAIQDSTLAGKPLAAYEARRSVTSQSYAQLAREVSLRLDALLTMEPAR